MRLGSLVGHLLEAYEAIAAEPGPADRVFAAFLHERRYLGSRDRAWLGDRLWSLVRGRLRWAALARAGSAEPSFEIPESLLHLIIAQAVGALPADDAGDPWREALDEVAERRAIDPAALRGALEWAQTGLAEKASSTRTITSTSTSTSTSTIRLNADIGDSEARWGWPGWLARALAARVGPEALEAQIAAFQQPAMPTVRVNTLRADIAQARAALAEAGLEPQPCEWSPEALRLARRANLAALAPYREGWIEIQDEASQLVAPALGAEREWRVVDACAGGGGKALHLAALMQDRGELLATDMIPARLEPLEARARRAGARMIRLAGLEDARALRGRDGVLIDAPCSGSGTLRRRPDLLWKLTPRVVADYAARQGELLRAWAPAVRPGGVLVYATCSFIEEENDAVVEAFLRDHGEFRAEDPAEQWQRWRGAPLPASAGHNPARIGRQLLPGWHGTDGFYIARLVRVSA